MDLIHATLPAADLRRLFEVVLPATARPSDRTLRATTGIHLHADGALLTARATDRRVLVEHAVPYVGDSFDATVPAGDAKALVKAAREAGKDATAQIEGSPLSGGTVSIGGTVATGICLGGDTHFYWAMERLFPDAAEIHDYGQSHVLLLPETTKILITSVGKLGKDAVMVLNLPGDEKKPVLALAASYGSASTSPEEYSRWRAIIMPAQV